MKIKEKLLLEDVLRIRNSVVTLVVKLSCFRNCGFSLIISIRRDGFW